MPFGKMHQRNPEIIKYSEIIGRSPSALSMKLTNIASLDPSIIGSGRKGLSGASKTDKMMWDEMNRDWNKFAGDIEIAFKSFLKSATNESFDTNSLVQSDVEEDVDYSGVNRLAMTSIRVGQNFFRQSVLSAYNSRCCISGLSIPKLLVASHIIPWRSDEKNRLNPRNGLCLSVLHDQAFDMGIITLSDDLKVVISDKYHKSFFPEDSFYHEVIISYEGKRIQLPEKFIPSNDFLSYHRTHIFKK